MTRPASTILMWAVAGSLLGVAVVARATVWDEIQIQISPPATNSTLGVGGRSAAVDPEGRVHLVYQTNPLSGNGQVFYVGRGTDGLWGAPLPISSADATVRNPSLALALDERLHVVWERVTPQGDEDIVHAMRLPDGTWTAPASVLPAAGFSRFPVGAVDSFGKFHLVWMDGRNAAQRILHGVWSEAAGWNGPHTLSVGGNSPQDATVDADRLGGVHVFWTDLIPGQPQDPIWSIHTTRLDAATGAIPAPTVLVQGIGLAIRPSVEAKDDGTVHLVWLDNRTATRFPAYEVFYKRYLPGIGWGKDKRFTYDVNNHGRPVIVAGAGESLNVAWEDYRASAPDIYYRQITPETGWDRDATRLTSDLTSSQSPVLVSLPDGRLLLVWTDSQETGSFRILSKVGTAAPTP